MARPHPIHALHQEEHQKTQTETANDTNEAEHIYTTADKIKEDEARFH